MKRLFQLLMLSFAMALFAPVAPVMAQEQTDTVVLIPQEQSNQEAEVIAEDAKVIYAQIGDEEEGEDTIPDSEEEPSIFQNLWSWIRENWAEAIIGLLVIIETIVNLTPTEKDNAWFQWLKDIINSIIPNNRKGGGVHT